MPPDNEPVTKADLAIIDGKLDGLKELVENEFRHLREDVNENTAWRQEFTKENGPWRRVADSIKVMKVFIAFLSPVVVWAVIEIIKALATAAGLR
jgi:hypothetical protein